MNYYKMKRDDANALGIPTLGHWASKTLVIVSDGDLRRAKGFDSDISALCDEYSLTALTSAEMIEARRSKTWAMDKG